MLSFTEEKAKVQREDRLSKGKSWNKNHIPENMENMLRVGVSTVTDFQPGLLPSCSLDSGLSFHPDSMQSELGTYS